MSDHPHPALPAFTPVPRQRDRHDGWKPEVQRAFIEALADTGSVKAAARAVGRSEVGAYQLRRHPQGAEFAAAWDAALDHGIRRIEDVAMDRALNGVEVPVYSYGKLVGTRMVFNDRLLMFMLRNRAPERFCADGRARGLSAMDKTQLERLKKQWHAEWQAQWDEEEEEARARIDQWLESMSRNHFANMPPRTRAAYEEFKRIEAEDRQNGTAAWFEEDDAAGDEGEAIAEPEPPAPEEKRSDGPRVRRLKDDGWG